MEYDAAPIVGKAIITPVVFLNHEVSNLSFFNENSANQYLADYNFDHRVTAQDQS